MTPEIAVPASLPTRVLITGATGLIGGRLCEVLASSSSIVPRAFIHSTASAARITRYPLDFVLGDLCDRASVDRAMDGCDAVIHLARGDEKVMKQGLENVLRAAARQGVSRFVHMSSVAVYGNSPPPESTSEDAPAKRSDMAYGNVKLAQEKRVQHYWKNHGLPVVILRPPNVYGPFAAFTVDLLNRIRNGKVAILDGGRNPCNLVYVDNLVESTLFSIWKPDAIGQTFFVTDGEGLTWEQCLTDHAELLGVSLPRISSADLASPKQEHFVRDSLRALPRVILSGELRSVLRQVPAIRSVELALYNGFQSMPGGMQQKIRRLITGPRVISKTGGNGARSLIRDNILDAQSRTVAHSNEKARRLLGYTAPVSYREGMALTEAWLRFSRML
jgi:nucleoside-diphosphate-sugar epimerase